MRRYQLPILLLLSLLFLMTGATEPSRTADEGFAVYNAARVHDGFLPYRDFYAIYAPGQFYAMAWVFKVFGASLSVSRGYDVVLRLVLVLIVYLITRKLISEKWAIVPSVLVALLLGTCGFHGYAMFPGLILSLLSVLCLFEFFTSKRTAWLIAGGVATGATEIFRQDVGLYTVASFSIVLLVFAFSLTPKANLQRMLRWEAIYLAAAAVVVIPVCLAFVIAGSAEDIWVDLFVFPATILHGIRSLPFPTFFINPLPLSNLRAEAGGWIRFYFPPIVCLCTLVQIALTWRTALQSERGSLRIYRTLALVILGGMLFAQVWSRNDRIHQVPVTVVALILTAKLLADFDFAKRLLPVRFLAAAVIAILAMVYVVSPLKRWNATKSLRALIGCPTPNGRAGCVAIEPDQAQAIDFVQKEIPRGERIFIGAPRHDRVFTGDLMSYFLSDRHSAVKYQEILPRLTNTLPVQQRIVEDLKSEHVRCILLYSGFDYIVEENASTENSGVTYLDDFIHNNFRLVQQFGTYTIWMNTSGASR